MKTKHHLILSAPVIQSGGQTQNASIRRRWFALALGGWLFTSVCALSPSASEAQCPQGWDVTGTWGLKQSNQAAPNSLFLKGGWTSEGGVLKSRIRGRASYPSGRGKMEGYVIAYVTGNNLHVEISWDNGLTGIYDGKIGEGGRIAGTCYERGSPSTKYSWYSDRAMICRSQPKPNPKQL
jgi:hypothetical protein